MGYGMGNWDRLGGSYFVRSSMDMEARLEKSNVEYEKQTGRKAPIRCTGCTASGVAGQVTRLAKIISRELKYVLRTEYSIVHTDP